MKKSARMAEDRMISGKLRPKEARPGAESDLVKVDGVTYAWSQRHGWVVFGKGLKALSFSIALRPARTRELILDFALRVDDDAGPPTPARIAVALEEGIRSAIAAGWDPESRGRAFRHEIGDES